MTSPQVELERIAALLAPILETIGFAFQLDNAGCASGGHFASGYYVRLPFRIGFIVRSRLGMVIYEADDRNVGHDDLMAALGHANDSQFMFDQAAMAAVGRGGQDPVVALVHDLTEYVRPVLEADDSVLLGLIRAGHRNRMRRLGIHDAS